MPRTCLRAPGSAQHLHLDGGDTRPLQAMLSAALLLQLLAAACVVRADTGPSVAIGAVDYKPVSVFNPNEISDKWWFWVIIGVIGLFLIVALYFTWRGVRNWKRHKKQEAARKQQEQEEQEDAAAKEAAKAQQQRSGDVEMGRLPLVAAAADSQQQPLSPQQRFEALQQDPAWLAERERRTAVHPKRCNW